MMGGFRLGPPRGPVPEPRYRADGSQRDKSFRTQQEARDFRLSVEYDVRNHTFTDPTAATSVCLPAMDCTAGLHRTSMRRLAIMDRPKRRNMVLDLRVMDDKIRLWLGSEDLDEDDRQALASGFRHE